MFAVFERRAGTFLGEVGLADFKRGLGPDFDGTPEAAWLFTGSSHGQGFAAEAMQALLAWFDAHRPEKRSVCIIDVENGASIRLASKLGFRRYGRATYGGSAVGKHERFVK